MKEACFSFNYMIVLWKIDTPSTQKLINLEAKLISKRLLSQPHFEASVRMKLTLPKVGTWSPLGLSKI
jgi:hypothetical protein